MDTYIMPIYNVIYNYLANMMMPQDDTIPYGKSKAYLVFAYWMRTTLPPHNICINGLTSILLQYFKWSMDDFSVLKVVGRGSFGKVMQVRSNHDGKIYALKVIKKKESLERRQVVHTQTERKVMTNFDHPFLVRLHFAFQNDAKLYMVLDFCSGGAGMFTEERTKFYSGEICLALKYLHSNGILYRGLVPENIMLDKEGHIKLTDFGLCKDSFGYDMTTHTFCGTPEYLAPETIQRQGQGMAVDWWMFGNILYEMLTGLPLFWSHNEDKRELFDMIISAPLHLPTHLSLKAQCIISRLLERDPEQRLGSSARDALEIEEHPFYEDIDWVKLYNKEVEPPFIPKVKDEYDTRNFDEEFTTEEPEDSFVRRTGSMLAAKDLFEGFSYDKNQGALY